MECSIIFRHVEHVAATNKEWNKRKQINGLTCKEQKVEIGNDKRMMKNNGNVKWQKAVVIILEKILF